MRFTAFITSHSTGNFLTLGAFLAFGNSGAIAKLLALPVFFSPSRHETFGLLAERPRLPISRIMLAVKPVLLCRATAAALRLGPFPDGDSAWAIGTGMTTVAAMAVQNAAHRIHLGQMPPATPMTETTTQMIHVAVGSG